MAEQPMWGRRNSALDEREGYWNAANEVATLNAQSRPVSGPVPGETLRGQVGMMELGRDVEGATFNARTALGGEALRNIQGEAAQRAMGAFSTLERTGDMQAYVTELGNIDQWQTEASGQAGAAAMRPFQNQTFRDFGRRLDFNGLLRGAQMGGHNELMQWVETGIRARNAAAAEKWERHKFDMEMRRDAAAIAENRRRYEEGMQFERDKEANDQAYRTATLELNTDKVGRANDAKVVQLIRDGYSPEAALSAMEGNWDLIGAEQAKRGTRNAERGTGKRGVVGGSIDGISAKDNPELVANRAGQMGITPELLGENQAAFGQAVDAMPYERLDDRIGAAFALVDPMRSFGATFSQLAGVDAGAPVDMESKTMQGGAQAYAAGLKAYADVPDWGSRQALSMFDAYKAMKLPIPSELAQAVKSIGDQVAAARSGQGGSQMAQTAPPLRADGSIDIDALEVDATLAPPGPRGGDGSYGKNGSNGARRDAPQPAGYINGQPMWRTGDEPNVANFESFNRDHGYNLYRAKRGQDPVVAPPAAVPTVSGIPSFMWDGYLYGPTSRLKM